MKFPQNAGYCVDAGQPGKSLGYSPATFLPASIMVQENGPSFSPSSATAEFSHPGMIKSSLSAISFEDCSVVVTFTCARLFSWCQNIPSPLRLRIISNFRMRQPRQSSVVISGCLDRLMRGERMKERKVKIGYVSDITFYLHAFEVSYARAYITQVP